MIADVQLKTLQRTVKRSPHVQMPFLHGFSKASAPHPFTSPLGGFVGRWVHGYVWLSPFAVHLKLPQHCSSATPQHKTKSIKSGGKKKTPLPTSTSLSTAHLHFPHMLSHSTHSTQVPRSPRPRKPRQQPRLGPRSKSTLARSPPGDRAPSPDQPEDAWRQALPWRSSRRWPG